MPIAALIALSAAAVSTPPAKAADVQPICRNPGVIMADTRSSSGTHSLDQEPPAQHILAVLRVGFDRCMKPIVVNAQVGTPKR